MLEDLSAEEWAHLGAFPPFAKFMHQLRREVDYLQDQMGVGALMGDDTAYTAMMYAHNVGRTKTLREILEYKPEPDSKEGDN